MALHSSLDDGGQTLTLTVSENFLFSMYREFREAYEHFTRAGGHIRVNLAGASYMDSSALGMLMLLREHTQAHGQDVVIVSPPIAVRRVLEIASFDKLFRIV